MDPVKTSADKIRQNQHRAVADAISPKQNSRRSAVQFTGRPAAEQGKQPRLKIRQVTQRAPRVVEITWGVTHLVRKMNGSIFGGEDFMGGEIGQEGELTLGQKIIIDDQKTFLSRRGSNQEDPRNRLRDKLSRPSVTWYHVLSVDGKDISGEKLYVRENTFALSGKTVAGDLSTGDQERLTVIVKKSLTASSSVSGEWTPFMESALKSGALSAGENSASLKMIQTMHALYVLGDLLSEGYTGLELSAGSNPLPNGGMQLIVPFVYNLIRPSIRIIVNGMEPGGNYTGWKNPDHMRSYLQIPFETFVAAFRSAGSGPAKLRLLKTLRSSDANIEKFITLMQGSAVEELLNESGPQGELESAMAGNPTASGKNGSGLVLVAFNYLFYKKFLPSRYSEDQINDLDYEGMETAESFQGWLTTNQFTMIVIRDAIRNSARDKSVPIETEEVEKLWKAPLESTFPKKKT